LSLKSSQFLPPIGEQSLAVATVFSYRTIAIMAAPARAPMTYEAQILRV